MAKLTATKIAFKMRDLGLITSACVGSVDNLFNYLPSRLLK